MLLFGGINLLGVLEMCILNLETGSEVSFTHPFCFPCTSMLIFNLWIE